MTQLQRKFSQNFERSSRLLSLILLFFICGMLPSKQKAIKNSSIGECSFPAIESISFGFSQKLSRSSNE